MKKKVAVSVLVVLVAVPAILYFAFPDTLVSAAKKYERGRAGLVEKRVSIPDFNIVYCDRDARGQAIVMVHGYAANKDHWTRMAAHIPADYRLVLPDLPGFGESDRKAELKYDIMSQVRRLKEFTDALGLKRFHLAGNSMGGNIAGRFASEYPGSVITLCLVDTGGVQGAKPSEAFTLIQAGKNPLVLTSVKDFDRFMSFGMHRVPYIPGPLKRHFAEEGARNRAFNEKVMKDLRAEPAYLEPVMDKIIAPTLIIWGDRDRILDVSAVPILDRGIADSTAVVMKECGHVPMIEYPAETAKLLISHIERKVKR